MKHYDIYARGNFVRSLQEHKIHDKYKGELIATTWLADKEILNDAIEGALSAKKPCAALPAFEKYKALSFISAELTKNKNELARTLSLESGKPWRYAIAEIERGAQTFLIAAEECKRLPAEYLGLDWTANGKNKEGLVRYFPIGIVAGISPFNFPLNLAAHKIAPAIAAGCPIILKPASSTPLSTLELALIIAKTDLPKGAVSILPMDRKTGNLLVTDDRINLLSFTGSPEIGWELKKQSGKKKVVLELGGNAGVIISKEVALEPIIEKCLVGAFSYSGQICIHAQRFFVHEKKYTEFLKLLTERTRELKAGDPTDPDTVLSNMIDEENAERVEKWVNEAVAAGARLVAGGKRKGSFHEATILTKTTSQMKIHAEENFGPVICVESFNTIEEAIKMVNDSKFGLQCGVFTDLVSELDLCFRDIEAGGILHNEMPTLRFDHMPYGGIKESGLGREGVKYAIREMLEAKVLVK